MTVVEDIASNAWRRQAEPWIPCLEVRLLLGSLDFVSGVVRYVTKRPLALLLPEIPISLIYFRNMSVSTHHHTYVRFSPS